MMGSFLLKISQNDPKRSTLRREDMKPIHDSRGATLLEALLFAVIIGINALAVAAFGDSPLKWKSTAKEESPLAVSP
jgi:Tfp pilus assembly protein PilV